MTSENTSSSTLPAPSNAMIACGRALTIATVGELHPKLCATLGVTSTVAVDVSQVDSVDAAGMQLLMTYCQDAMAQNVKVTWTTPSDAVRQAAKTLGMERMLGW